MGVEFEERFRGWKQKSVRVDASGSHGDNSRSEEEKLEEEERQVIWGIRGWL